jgi:hypothetical protein
MYNQRFSCKFSAHRVSTQIVAHAKTPLIPLIRLLLLLLGLQVVVGTVGNGTTNEDEGVEADTEATGRGRGR